MTEWRWIAGFRGYGIGNAIVIALVGGWSAGHQLMTILGLLQRWRPGAPGEYSPYPTWASSR